MKFLTMLGLSSFFHGIILSIFWNLFQALGLLRPAGPLLRNEPHVAQCDRVRLFTDVEPFLVPVVERRVPWAVQVLSFHAVMEVEVHTPGYLRTTASFLPQIEKMAEKIKMGLKDAICSQRCINVVTRRIELGCRLQIPIS